MYEWLSMLMKPGATAMPVASTSVAARASASGPMAAMRSPAIATSRDNWRVAAAVVDEPLRMMRSKVC